MASYHLSVKIIKRSAGRSSVAAAAYRARCALHDQRQGMRFDYSQKPDLAHSEILAPENAAAFVKDRASLWNAVEAGEKRKDAQLAREVEIALPAELSLEQQIALTRAFVQDNFVAHGMVADINIHHSETNPHAHILLTLREIDQNGFGKKVRAWNRRENVLTWRAEWEAVQNKHLAMAGLDVRVDARSLADMGVELIPQTKLGVGRHRRQKLDQQRNYEEVLSANGQKILADPTIALYHLTYYHATFTRRDVYRYLNAHSWGVEQFDRCRRAIFDSSELVTVGTDEKGELRYSTRTMVATEKAMLQASAMMGLAHDHGVQPKYIEQAVARRSLHTGQEIAFRHMAGHGNLALVTGKAGSGKSYTLSAVKEAYESQGYHVQGAALSGIAAEALERSSGIVSGTIHRKIWEWEQGRNRLHKKSVLVIDEAAMVGTRQMAVIVREALVSRAKLILVGDDQQLQSIEAGAAFRGIRERVGCVSLREVQRQEKDWQKEATRLLAGDEQDIGRALDLYRAHGNIRMAADTGDIQRVLVTDWARDFGDGQSRLILAHRRRDVATFNRLGRWFLQNKGYLGEKSAEVETTNGKIRVSANERIMFLRNDMGLGIKNGSLGTLEKIHGRVLAVKLDNGRQVAVDTRFYKDFTYGYAATIHKSQGATVDYAYVYATRSFDRHLAYVALTRHRKDMVLYHARNALGNDMVRIFSRPRMKSLVADYGRLRGLVPVAPAKAEKAVAEPQRQYEIVLSYETRSGRHEEQFTVQAPEGLDRKQLRSFLDKEARAIVNRSRDLQRAANLKALIRPARQVAKGRDIGPGLEM